MRNIAGTVTMIDQDGDMVIQEFDVRPSTYSFYLRDISELIGDRYPLVHFKEGPCLDSGYYTLAYHQQWKDMEANSEYYSC